MEHRNRARILQVLYNECTQSLARVLDGEDLAQQIGASWDEIRPEIVFLEENGYITVKETQVGTRIFRTFHLTAKSLNLCRDSPNDETLEDAISSYQTKVSHETHFHGSVTGPVHTGSGDNIVPELRFRLVERVRRNLQLLLDSSPSDFRACLGNFLRSLLEHSQMRPIVQQILQEGVAEVVDYGHLVERLVQDSCAAARVLEKEVAHQELASVPGLTARLSGYDQTRAQELLLAKGGGDRTLEVFTPYVYFWQQVWHELESADTALPSSEELQERTLGENCVCYADRRAQYERQWRVRPWGALIRLLAWADWLGYKPPILSDVRKSWLLQRELDKLQEKETTVEDVLLMWSYDYPDGATEKARQHAQELKEQALADARNLTNEILNKLDIQTKEQR